MWQRFVRWFSPETRFKRAWHISVTAVGLIVIIVLLGDGAYGLFTHINQSNAQNAKARLDTALTDATRMNVPQGMLQPIRTQEQQAAAATDGSLVGYQHATDVYSRLQAQVESFVTMPPSQARALAQKDLTQLQASVATLTKGKYAEAVGYQSRLQQAQTSFKNATTTRDYFTVDGFALDQVAAATAYKPTSDRLKQFSSLVSSEQKLLEQITGVAPQPAPLLCADGVGGAYGSTPAQYWTVYNGLMSYPQAKSGSHPVEAQWLSDDQTLFHAATTVKDYDTLNQQLDGQIAQIEATNAALVPNVAASYLATFKANIQTLTDYDNNTPAIKNAFSRIYSLSSFPSLPITGWHASAPQMQNFKSDIANFQKQYDQDAQLLAGATYGNYTKAVKQIQTHLSGMQFDLVYAKTYNDIKTFVDLIAQGQARTIKNTQSTGDNKNYPDAYEYIYQGTGIGDVISPNATPLIGVGRLYNAQSTEDYQYLDTELQMFINNITAMLKNLDDQTPYNQPHQTDNTLMQNYGVMQGQVMIVSLREQAARFYQDGKLVKAVYVTTGAPNLPSAPGINCSSGAVSPSMMVSPDKPGNPDYYKPTPVKFAIYYHNYGLEIHDAWWRSEFGPRTNLPHYDPAAFNGGSHGCINISKEDMPWVFHWINYQNIPVIVY